MSKRNIIQHYRGQGIPDDLSAGEFAIDISNTGAPILLVSDDGTGVQSLTMFRGNEEPTEEAYQSQLWLDTSVTGGGVDSTYLVANNLTTAYSGTYVLDAYQGKLLNDSLSAVVTEIQDIWETIYPVGSIYMSVNSASPETLFGGTWEQISEGRALFGAGTCDGITYTAGTTVDKGLPNITGEAKVNETYSGSPFSSGSFSGAFYSVPFTSTQYYISGRSTGSGWGSPGFDASRSNSIYGSSTTVQPNAFVVYIWKRTA